MQKINSQSELDKLLDLPIWEDSVIQNVFILSPAHRRDGVTLADGAPPTVLVNVLITEHEETDILGLQLKFRNVDTIIRIYPRGELKPSAKYSPTGNEIMWAFNGNYYQFDIRCATLEYRTLSQEELEYVETYIIENPFHASGGHRK